MTFSRFSALPRHQAIETLSLRILNNFLVTEKVIRFCKASGFAAYRLSSDLTPVINHPDVNLKLQDLPNSADIFAALSSIKTAITETGLKVSAHPSEYISLTSTNESAISNSVRDLESHAELFDLIGLPSSHEAPLNIHCRQDGDPLEISGRFAKTFDKLPENIKNRLALEVNDNKDGTWTIENLFQHFHRQIGVPITFDSLHHKLCHNGQQERDAFEMAHSTWRSTPVFHYSEGINGTRKHADYATSLPNDFGHDVFWDVELKAKDLAITKMLQGLQ